MLGPRTPFGGVRPTCRLRAASPAGRSSPRALPDNPAACERLSPEWTMGLELRSRHLTYGLALVAWWALTGVGGP